MGISTVTVLVLFTGGVQVISVGLSGKYIGRICDEVHRAIYLIDEAVNVTVRGRSGPDNCSV